MFRRGSRPRQLHVRLAAVLAALSCAAILAGFVLLHEGAAGDNDPLLLRPDASITILGRAITPRLPAGFVGVSVEYPALTEYTGPQPADVNPVLEGLLRDLAPGQSPVIRIGGDSTDATWWPTPGIRRPGGVTYSLSPRWLSVVAKLSADLGARLILGIDLEAGLPVLGRAEARALVHGLGPRRILALEIGNEAYRYSLFPWYHDDHGRPVFARPSSYGFRAFVGEFARMARALPRGVATAGPTVGGPQWMANLATFVRTQRSLGLVTFHQYPTNRCFTRPRSPDYPTVWRLLSTSTSEGPARQVAAYVAIARRYHLPFRVDELNSAACGGKSGVSDAFASALWVLDTLFALANAGVTGVNVHTFPGAAYALFSFRHVHGQWAVSVAPEYYGLVMFALAAPPGARLLAIRKSASAGIRAWATRARDGTLRVVLINDDLAHRHVVRVGLPERGSSASVVMLAAPSPYATGRVTLGGGSFDPAGVLVGVRPASATARSADAYLVRLPPASAALLTIHP